MTSFNQFIGNGSGIQKNAPEWLRAFQEPAMKRFVEHGLPDVKTESWKYTNPNLFSKMEYTKVDTAGAVDKQLVEDALLAGASRLVFVDGIFSEEYSSFANLPDGVLVKDLQTAFQADDQELAAVFAEHKSNESFQIMNDAFFNQGAFIKIAANCHSEVPIQILNVSSTQGLPVATFPRNIVLVEEGARAVLAEGFIGFNQGGFNNGLTQIKLRKNSHLDYYRVQSESTDALHYSQVDVDLEAASRLNMLSLDCGAKVARHNINVRLKGHQATAHVDGIYLTDGKQHVDNHSIIDHQVAETFSSQTYKGALKGHSKAVFNGKVFVRKDAQLCNAHQINRNLMLSDTAEVDTKPELQLDANDIKCSHGATVGQLRDDEIFYLQSRAIPKDQAVRMLSRSYVADLVNGIEYSSIQASMDSLLNRFFEEEV